MLEETNRFLTDQISDFLFITKESVKINLLRECINPNKNFFVGNIMINTLILNLDRAKNLDYYKKFNLGKGSFALITIHRPFNVDNKNKLGKIVNIINFIQEKVRIICPLHPGTKKKLIRYNLIEKINKRNTFLIESIDYLEFLNLMLNLN